MRGASSGGLRYLEGEGSEIREGVGYRAVWLIPKKILRIDQRRVLKWNGLHVPFPEEIVEPVSIIPNSRNILNEKLY